MIEVALTNEEKVAILAQPTTATGRPAQLDGGLRATLVSGEGSVEPGPGPNEVTLLSGDTPGNVDFLIEADADLGEGVVLLQDTVRLVVSGAQAQNLGLVAGTPVPK